MWQKYSRLVPTKWGQQEWDRRFQQHRVATLKTPNREEVVFFIPCCTLKVKAHLSICKKKIYHMFALPYRDTQHWKVKRERRKWCYVAAKSTQHAPEKHQCLVEAERGAGDLWVLHSAKAQKNMLCVFVTRIPWKRKIKEFSSCRHGM